ncbi:CU044_5270 family protein [Nonomuraea sp. NPDC003804]|uniref:CU044_5270 family protein n=1 Tax=Nonomuraea sp. NPDC003804 TaxID=3154547 RepID=UPI0033AA9481
MNPIEELRAARPAHLGDVPTDERTRRSELAYAMSHDRPTRRRRKPRLAWGLGLAGAAAGVTAVAVLATSTGAGTAPRPPSAAIGSGTPASSTPASSAPVRLSAQQVLLVAATSAERRPPASGRFWHTETFARGLVTTSDGYTMASEQRSEMWVGKNGQWSRGQYLGAEPATPDDRAKWEAAGSPAEVRISMPGKGTRDRRLPLAAGKPYSDHHSGKEVFWLGRNVTLDDLAGLPDDEAGLKAWLLRNYEGKDTESDRPMAEDAWLFQVTAGLITDMPVSAKVRGAAFRMLAALPSVTAVGQVTDGQGRSGTAIAIETESRVSARDADHGILQDRLIIDEAAGVALARESVVVKPGGMQAGLAPGTVWNTATVVRAEWTDSRTS